MRARYVSELAEGSKVDADFALRSKEVRRARNGDTYLALELADRTGSIPAILFRPVSESMVVPVGSIARVTGTVTVYRGTRRLSVETMLPADTWDPDDFLAHGKTAPDELKRRLVELLRSVHHAELRKVLRSVFDDKRFFSLFCECPAAQSHHHAYVGGLMEHTVAVAEICDSIAARHSAIDRDLLVTAAILHDVGKVDELSFRTTIGYTDDGRLLGHVILGLQRVRTAIVECGLGSDLARHLEHALLSHHGELEWGSPKRPSTLEALALHHADNLDAKVAGFEALMDGAARADEVWTDASNLFRRPLYVPRPAEDDRPRPTYEDAEVHHCRA